MPALDPRTETDGRHDRPHPLQWLERLLDVNADSDFTSEQKIIIARKLREAIKELGGNVASTR
jgi:hypothetical protein